VEHDYSFPEGQKAYKGDLHQHMLNVVLTKKNDQWKIATLQVTTIDPNATAFDPAKRQAGK